MTVDLSHIRRYELKYRVSENKAAAIRNHIQGICSLDSHADPETGGYIVNNLYFDTPDLKFYYDTRHRKLTRFKPRARFYGQTPRDSVWPEIKYRNASVIWKRRTRITLDQWPDLFRPTLSGRTQPVFKDRYDSFEDMIHRFDAEPVLHVRYFREPFVTDLENYGRVTFDRSLSSRLAYGAIDLHDPASDMLWYDDAQTTRETQSPVILEIKVETLVPQWAIDLIRRFNLVQTGFSKYCYGIEYHMGYSASLRQNVR